MRKSIVMNVLVPLCFVVSAGCSTGPLDAQENESSKDEKRRAKVVAKADGIELTVGEVEDKIKASIQPAKYKEKEELEELVRSLIDQHLMVKEAKERGYDELPKVRNGVKRVLYNLMQTKYIQDNLTIESIKKEEVKKYYKEHESDYNQPSLVRASHVLVSDKEKAEDLLKQAGAEDFDLRKFRQLATEHSEDEITKKRGGDLRYFSREGEVWYSSETVPGEAAEAAFSIEVKVRADMIVMDDRDAADSALKEVMSSKSEGKVFRKLVKEQSIDEATKKRGGDTGWFDIEGRNEQGEQVVPPKVASTAFSFQTPGTSVPRTIKVDDKYYILRITGRDDPGSLYPEVIKSDEGYHVIWVVNRRPALHKSIEDVEFSIRQRLWQEKKRDFIENFVESLEKKYNVKVNEENLDKVVVDLSGLPPAAKKRLSK